MRTFCLLLSLLIFASPWAASAQNPNTPKLDNILGQWSSGSLSGAGSVGRQNCTAIGYSERKVRLSLVPGTDRVEGEWVRANKSMWMLSDDMRCRWVAEDTHFEPLYFASWVFLLDGTYDSARQVLKIHGQFTKCDGNACSQLMTPAVTKPFDTEMKRVGERLVDTNSTEDSSDDIEFVRVSDEAEQVEEATSAFESALKLLDQGKFEQFYDQATSSSFRDTTPKQQFLAKCSAFRTRVGATISRTTLTSIYAIYAPTISKSQGEYVLLISGVQTAKKIHGGEYIVLVKDGGAWKVLWFNYAS